MNVPAAHAAAGSNVLNPGETLQVNQSLHSPNGQFKLWMQNDGNFVLYSGTQVMWSSGTANQGGALAIMQGDGNLVIYNAAWHPLWATNTGCIYPSVTYYGKGNFGNVFSETLSAEVCFGSGNVWTVWMSHKFSGYPGWSGTELGRGVFWDPGRYGGALTIWSNDRDTFGWGPVTYNEDTFLRIWVTPNGQEYQYGGQPSHWFRQPCRSQK